MNKDLRGSEQILCEEDLLVLGNHEQPSTNEVYMKQICVSFT